MKCPINFRGIRENDWRSLTDAIQRTMDELYRLQEVSQIDTVRNGQERDAYLPYLVLRSTPRGRKVRLEAEDSNPDDITLRCTDLGG